MIGAVEQTRRLVVGVALTVAVAVAALAVHPVDANAPKTTWRVQLDGDERLETVRIRSGAATSRTRVPS